MIDIVAIRITPEVLERFGRSYLMKTALFACLIITCTSACLVIVNYPSSKNKNLTSTASVKLIEQTRGSVNSKDKINFCPILDVFFNKLESCSLSNNVKSSNNELDAEKWKNNLISLSKTPIFSQLENTTLLNNACSSAVSSFLIDIYLQMGMPQKAERMHQRLLELANINNQYAIRGLCVSDSPLIKQQEKIHYCEVALNRHDSNNHLASTVLESAYAMTDQADKLAALCDKNTDNKDSCYWSLKVVADDLYYKKDFSKAFVMYNKTAGYDTTGTAALQIAEMSQRGEGTNRDLRRAVYWYYKSLEKIHDDYLQAVILNDMGAAYVGLTNYVEGFQCYLKAAKMGLALSQLNLAQMYTLGIGTIQDNEEAYAWISNVLAQGLKDDTQIAKAVQLKQSLSMKLAYQDRFENASKKADDLAHLYYKEYVLHENN